MPSGDGEGLGGLVVSEQHAETWGGGQLETGERRQCSGPLVGRHHASPRLAIGLSAGSRKDVRS